MKLVEYTTGFRTNHARCECGKKLKWRNRYQLHKEHVANDH